MLTELSVVEQRYLAVREALDGARITDVATRYGVDRRTVHRWVVRYANEGLGALADRSSRPDRCPHQIAPEIEARIVALRRSYPGWGPRTILSKLRRELDRPPSRSSIYRCLLRHRLIEHKPRRRRPQAQEEQPRCRIGTEAIPRHGYRDCTNVVLRVMLDVSAPPDPWDGSARSSPASMTTPGS
jgi:transposase